MSYDIEIIVYSIDGRHSLIKSSRRTILSGVDWFFSFGLQNWSGWHIIGDVVVIYLACLIIGHLEQVMHIFYTWRSIKRGSSVLILDIQILTKLGSTSLTGRSFIAELKRLFLGTCQIHVVTWCLPIVLLVIITVKTRWLGDIKLVYCCFVVWCQLSCSARGIIQLKQACLEVNSLHWIMWLNWLKHCDTNFVYLGSQLKSQLTSFAIMIRSTKCIDSRFSTEEETSHHLI